MQDFQRAIELAESDPKGENLQMIGSEAFVQAHRNHILSCSHFELGSFFQRE
jgi:hypothetical protein